MKTIWTWLVNPSPNGPASTLLLRLMAGGVFLWEGILKFVYVNQGVGRFTKLGMPFPHFTADFVGYLEIVGGLMVPENGPWMRSCKGRNALDRFHRR
jgi:putative oxidoreductase